MARILCTVLCLLSVLGVPMTAILQITDGTNTVDLLAEGNGFLLRRWRPAMPDYKASGIRQNSGMADGTRLVMTTWADYVESMEIVLRQSSQDIAIRDLRTLRQLLQRAAEYWTTNWQNTPVYLVAKAQKETQTRYALISSGRIPEDEQPYAQPFFLPTCRAIGDTLSLIIVHGPWLESAPGTIGSCVQASATQDWAAADLNWSGSPAQSEDDGYNQGGNNSLALGFGNFHIGYDTEDANHAAVRFPNVTVPQGAIILNAYIDIEAHSSVDIMTCRVDIHGQKSSTAAILVDYVELCSRPLTTHKVAWHPGAWVATTHYQTPALTDIVQEIVSQSAWASGNAMLFTLFDLGSTPGAYRDGVAWDHADPETPCRNRSGAPRRSCRHPKRAGDEAACTCRALRVIGPPHWHWQVEAAPR